MAKEGVKQLEAALEREKQDRADAETRATRANERAREADEAYRKLQLELVAAKDEILKLREVAAVPKAATVPPKAASVAPKAATIVPAPAPAAPVIITTGPVLVPVKDAGGPSSETYAQVEQMLRRIEGLRELLATASIELSQLHSDEVALGKKRSRVLSDACALLARAVGVTGQAPPPIPSAALEARLSIAPVVDISEVADLIESLRPPRAPKVE
jgi:hypothetical protein